MTLLSTWLRPHPGRLAAFFGPSGLLLPNLCGLAATSLAAPGDPGRAGSSADTLVIPGITLPEIQVTDSYERALATARSATEGTVTRPAIESRPLRRVGEILETVPGFILSQHSGEGKANPYSLRGFNLDHGTDVAITLAGGPINMPSHGHVQGCADLSFALPELIAGIDDQKGTYSAATPRSCRRSISSAMTARGGTRTTSRKAQGCCATAGGRRLRDSA